MTDLEVTPCPDCGQAHVRESHPGRPTCIRHKAKHNGGGPCLQWRWTGQLVCKRHGAMTPGAKEKAAARVADERARVVVGKLFDVDAPPIKDATAAALRLAGQLSSMVDRLGATLDSGDSLSLADRAFFTAMVGQLRPLLIDIERLGLGRAELALSLEQAKFAAVALGRMFEFLGLPLEQRASGLEFFRSEVRAELEAGGG